MYSYINCHRSIGHLVDWYNRYCDDGFPVIGLYTLKCAFKLVASNMAIDISGLHINYPCALNNNYTTWMHYQNLYWPTEYLI
ncbi:protein DipZ [Mycobacterium lepromatosis]|nr:protein DipZ [Mycobacterium lepromatosis]